MSIQQTQKLEINKMTMKITKLIQSILTNNKIKPTQKRKLLIKCKKFNKKYQVLKVKLKEKTLSSLNVIYKYKKLCLYFNWKLHIPQLISESGICF